MELTKLNPWNWFKNEEESEIKHLPVNREGQPRASLAPLHHEIDRLFESVFRGFGFPSLSGDNSFAGLGQNVRLKPNMDIEASDNEYAITVEVPGVDEDNIKLELVENALTIKGEKRQESENKDKDVYRVERSYGSFQRVLSLPEDANHDGIDAQFKNGLLIITIPRKVIPKEKGKIIDIKRAR